MNCNYLKNHCSDQKIFAEYNLDYNKLIIKLHNDNLNLSSASKVYEPIQTDRKIIENLKNHFIFNENFNNSSIFYPSFAQSYIEAINELYLAHSVKACFFLFKAKQVNSLVDGNFPVELIQTILIKSLPFIQSTKDFCCNIYPKIDLKNQEIINLITKEMQPKEVKKSTCQIF